MCWYTNCKKYSVKKIAERDIPVFKVVKYYKGIETIYSFFYGHEYEIGRMYLKSEPLYPIKWKMDYYSINEGFHSYNERCSYEVRYSNPLAEECIYIDGIRDISSAYRISLKPAIMHCIIPTGAEYFENEYGEIVSNMLKPILIEKI